MANAFHEKSRLSQASRVKASKTQKSNKAEPARKAEPGKKRVRSELVIITGMSGSGKASVLRALEDLGYYAVDNLPIGLVPTFAELVRDSTSIRSAAIVVDVREGQGLRKLPAVYRRVKSSVNARLVFMEADDESILRRFSETRRPHPLSDLKDAQPIGENIAEERKMLAPIRAIADLTIDTSKFNVHDLRAFIRDQFSAENDASKILIRIVSFGFRYGLPPECDLVFDVRFLPNPNYIPKYKKLTGRNPAVARYIRSFPQTGEFIGRITDLLVYLLPHYIREGKTYLTIGFGCTGGHHRSVMIADAIRRNLADSGYPAKVTHRDAAKQA